MRKMGWGISIAVNGSVDWCNFERKFGDFLSKEKKLNIFISSSNISSNFSFQCYSHKACKVIYTRMFIVALFDII